MTVQKFFYAYSKPRLIKTSLSSSSIFPHGKGLVTLELFLGCTGMKLKANVVQSPASSTLLWNGSRMQTYKAAFWLARYYCNIVRNHTPKINEDTFLWSRWAIIHTHTGKKVHWLVGWVPAQFGCYQHTHKDPSTSSTCIYKLQNRDADNHNYVPYAPCPLSLDPPCRQC